MYRHDFEDLSILIESAAATQALAQRSLQRLLKKCRVRYGIDIMMSSLPSPIVGILRGEAVPIESFDSDMQALAARQKNPGP